MISLLMKQKNYRPNWIEFDGFLVAILCPGIRSPHNPWLRIYARHEILAVLSFLTSSDFELKIHKFFCLGERSHHICFSYAFHWWTNRRSGKTRLGSAGRQNRSRKFLHPECREWH